MSPISEARALERRKLRALQLLYDFGYLTLLMVGFPVVLVMLAMSPRWRAGLRQRLGDIPHREGDETCIWIHGVSVGEVLAAESLIKAYEEEHPDWAVWISTTTRTGQAAARKAFPGHTVFYYPLDLSWTTSRVLDRIRPSVVILMELEIWPNFLLSTWARGIPVMLANGRITEKSYRNYRILQRIIPEPMDRIRVYCVQTEEYARRFRELGVPDDRIFVTGTMKFDTIPVQPDPEASERLRKVFRIEPGDRVLIGGSTHPGEDEALVRIYGDLRRRHPGARLILVPRHPERLPAAEECIRNAGYRVERKTSLDRDLTREISRDSVILVDTMGELARIYGVADVVFVGGSLIPHGGQNMMEPAGLGKPVLFGPHVRNFREPVDALLAGRGAVMVQDERDLEFELVRLFEDAEAASAMGRRARGAVLAQRGATRRMLSVFREILDESRPGSPGREIGER